MEIKEQVHDQFVTLAPEGDLDANSSIHLDEVIARLVDANQVNIHIDASGINYISSAGLGVFVSHLEDLTEKDGRFVLTRAKASVLDVFKLLGLDQLENLTIVETEGAVLPYFQSK
ncbi:MAG: STAS domain-containing protein [Bacteroidota bacterium]